MSAKKQASSANLDSNSQANKKFKVSEVINNSTPISSPVKKSNSPMKKHVTYTITVLNAEVTVTTDQEVGAVTEKSVGFFIKDGYVLREYLKRLGGNDIWNFENGVGDIATFEVLPLKVNWMSVEKAQSIEAAPVLKEFVNEIQGSWFVIPVNKVYHC
jgi:hypothetical protein